MRKLRVGVFMGGKSIEKEVSFNSGRTVCDHLDTVRYDIIPIFQTDRGNLFILPIRFLHRGKISDFEHRLTTQAQEIKWDDLPSLIDFAYIATHGRYAEDGTLQGFFDVLGIPYLGSKIFASAVRMDKAMQKVFMHAAGIEVPRDITILPEEINNITEASILNRLVAANIALPVVIKPHSEGSSLGVSVVFEPSALVPAVLQAAIAYPYKKQTVLIEEKIEGMEFSCITLVDYKTGKLLPLPPTEIVPEEGSHIFDYDQKYMPGRGYKFTPPRCSATIIKKIHDVCARVMHALDITTMSRIDGFVTCDERVIIIDPNTLSGMGPASFLFREAAEINMSHSQLINHLIETELHAYGMLDAILKTEEKQAQIMNTQRIRVAVLMGGRTNEREVSLESGRNVTYKLSPQKYEAIPIFVSSKLDLFTLHQSLLVRNSTAEIESLVDSSMRVNWHDLPKIADFVFIALHGGEGENGAIQGILEMLELPYNGSGVLTSSLCMDKFKTTQFLKYKGFDVPQSMLLDKKTWQEDKCCLKGHIQTTLQLPVIVKPHDDGCSVMVQKASNSDELVDAIDTVFAHNKSYVLIEEYIKGMELTVGVIGNSSPRALPPSYAVATQGVLSIEEKFLPGAGENQTPAPLPLAVLTFVQKTIESAYRALQCKGYARIDCFYQTAEQSPTNKERVVILEVNTLPGMTPATCIFHQAAEVGIKPMDFIDTIIELGCEEHRKIELNQQQEIKVNSDFTHTKKEEQC